ncbi:hypothetical protein BO70DRAFT_372176 [Aspergillus heteromorphus CBS 117.55]|uniref:Cyclase n=1 Tax=Aspergillus heteromorphus CBS 117.55 TaxID=1448321 RepID=A0A317VWN7_9EURO|nr:uncharacterized protein BO70DRAFT_372176 [Aspergillus heteromorphus CBS 117.55]PWY77427.1 hypothetical protein BO70DRAFT_372176 [Aspergillus heteromorphus CBS 117.55]
MSTPTSNVQAPDQLPWDPNCERFPSRKELPEIPGAPKDAAWVWGKDDAVSGCPFLKRFIQDCDSNALQLGRLNLLTPARVKEAAKEIISGEMFRLDLPLHIPEAPAFGRECFHHDIKEVVEDVVFDDTYTLNTQSSTQWDGFRHFAHLESKTFYNNVHPATTIKTTPTTLSIHHWATHGITSRAILLDYYTYHTTTHPAPYDPYTTHRITLRALTLCAASQGIDLRPVHQGGDIRPGDILLIRSGFVDRYHSLTPAQRGEVSRRSHEDLTFAGLSQDEDMLDWLHDCYFAAVAGDSPTFEAWPPAKEGGYMHQQILALWGMPIGEMWDLEALAARCREVGRWGVFLTSAPANVLGGVGSHANATAIM